MNQKPTLTRVIDAALTQLLNPNPSSAGTEAVESNRRIEMKTVKAKVTPCPVLLLFASLCTDLSDIQVAFKRQCKHDLISLEQDLDLRVLKQIKTTKNTIPCFCCYRLVG